MAGSLPARAKPTPTQTPDKQRPTAAFQQADLAALGPYLFMLMLRNITSDGFVLQDPANPGQWSLPGCIIAAPSYPAATPGVDQDYIFNWVRDGALVAIEIAANHLPASPAGGVRTLIDYVNFAHVCQQNAHPTLGHACFRINGQPRQWTEQNDSPALQTIALLKAWDQLDAATQALATTLISNNLTYLLTAYQNATTNLWEEHQALSFFARATHLRCFRECAANTIGLPVPDGVDDAITWLEAALATHWNGTHYVSMLAPGADAGVSAVPESFGYDPNIDIVSAAIYGAIPVTDTKLLATAERLRAQWTDPISPSYYPINGDDNARGIGPLLGRYPGDNYDGDVSHPVFGGHPWPLCTANFAELYFALANEIETAAVVPLDQLSQGFFAQVGITDATSVADAATALRLAGDAMLRAIIFHSDNYELSEQFDGYTGFEKSVRNLTWSYAAFLSALRARAGSQ